jgi:probable HAF family extracellular repeat protein
LGFTNALNNKGQVVGQSNLFGDQTAHPFLWDRGTLKDLGTLGGDFGTASWLNDTGDVAGGARTADASFHAFFWRKGVMTDLGTVNGDTCSAAHNMNADGTVVGTSGDCGGQFEKHGFVSVHGGQMIDLNEFVPPGSTLTVTDGETINNRGEIAGSGMLPNGDFHTVVLIPCDHQHGTSDAKGCQT